MLGQRLTCSAVDIKTKGAALGTLRIKDVVGLHSGAPGAHVACGGANSHADTATVVCTRRTITCPKQYES